MEKSQIEELFIGARKEIAEKGYGEDALDFSDIVIDEKESMVASILSNNYAGEFDITLLLDNIQRANLSVGLDFYYPLKDRGIKLFLKKIVRKALKPFVLYLSQKQELFNRYTVDSLTLLYQYTKIQEEQIRSLKERIKELEK